jgi:hypothetical protein
MANKKKVELANKKKVEFSVAAVAMTMLVFSDLPRNFGVDGAVLDSLVAYDRANKWMLPSLRIILRVHIEPFPERLNVYKEALQVVKDNCTKEFSITIKGSGTKANILAELQGWIAVIDSKTVYELIEGIDLEDINTTLQTDLPYSE